MNCSWLPYLTQRWCCERDHMRKGQIKNHGYSLTLKLCRYSPQVLLSLPTSISECCCLSEKKKKQIVYFSRTRTWKLDCVTYTFNCAFFVFLFVNFQTCLGRMCDRIVRETQMHRQPASYSFAKLEIVADVCFSAVLRSCVFKNVICSGVCNFTLKKTYQVHFLFGKADIVVLTLSSGLDLRQLLKSFFKLQTCAKCTENKIISGNFGQMQSRLQVSVVLVNG